MENPKGLKGEKEKRVSEWDEEHNCVGMELCCGQAWLAFPHVNI